MLSYDPAGLGTSCPFLIREVMETAKNFDEAVDALSTRDLPTDAIFLVSGAHEGEMAVVERTPQRSKVRRAVDGYVAATNDYRALDVDARASGSPLQETSCSRYDRVMALLASRRPEGLDDCFTILEDDAVRMDMTTQHMAFRVANGGCSVRLPAVSPQAPAPAPLVTPGEESDLRELLGPLYEQLIERFMRES